MIDTRIFFMTLEPESMGDQRFFAPVMFHDKGFIQQQGEGWTPVSHTITPTADGTAILAIMCTREVDAPGAENFPTPDSIV